MEKTKDTKNAKIISGFIACLGISSLVALEYYVSPEKDWSILTAIIAAAVIRAGMFIEGTALGKYNRKHAKVAFVMSVLLSIGFLIYIGFIYTTSNLQPYMVCLFVLGTVSVSFWEWVTGKRLSYGISLETQNMQKQIDDLLGEVDKQANEFRTLVITAKGQAKRFCQYALYYRKQLGRIQSELASIKAALENAQSELKTALPARSYYLKVIGKLLLVDGKRYALCHQCEEWNEVPSRARSCHCSNCHTHLWEKEQETAIAA